MRIARSRSSLDTVATAPSGRNDERVITVALTCHPDTPSAGVNGIEARLIRTGPGMLVVKYVAFGILDRARVPAPGPAQLGERLWQHTCFEVFIRAKGAAGYHELNFAPSRAWAAFAFEQYRQGVALSDDALDPRIDVSSDAGSLTLEASVRLGLLAPLYANAPLCLALAAVIEDHDGTLSYWALAHPPGHPDFHHPDAFSLELDEARA
jgi:hypothetical protein